MKRFLRKAMSFLFGSTANSVQARPGPMSDRERILGKIAKWERLAADYEAMDCRLLARDLRASIAEYRRIVSAPEFFGTVSLRRAS